MKNKNLLIVIAILWLCTASDCTRDKDDCHKRIYFINNSSKDVYIDYCEYCSDDFMVPSLTSLQANSGKVKPNEKNSSMWSWSCLEFYVAQKEIVVYVFDAEVMESIPRDTIIKYRMVLKTIHPTIEEMERSDWTITFTDN